MAVVDAAVGIKTAVNFHEKKNKLGTYQPPLGVLYDTAFLHSLEDRHISNGSAEVLKMACIKDQNLFELLETYGQDMIAQKFQVCTCLQASHQVVAAVAGKVWVLYSFIEAFVAAYLAFLLVGAIMMACGYFHTYQQKA
jgi:3-dehydroquinate synthetase